MNDALKINYSSHDHIVQIQNITKGRVLVAPEKACSLNKMWLYGEKPDKPAYFVNCVFPDSIKTRDHRDNGYSMKPGFRHDLLFDFEKKSLCKGKWVKNERITDAEKEELVDVLVGLPWIGWAGKTPHGVHACVYFDSWAPNMWSGQIVKWAGEQIENAGYRGSVVIDWSPSVNCNRPSRYLEEFSFWRAGARLNAAEVLAASSREIDVTSKQRKLTFKLGSIPDQDIRADALKARTDGKSSTETACELGKSTEWVEKLWANVTQEAFNPFNEDLHRIVGPRSSWGFKRQRKYTVHHNAAWSWEWCWAHKMDLETALEMLFSSPIFKQILAELKTAYDKIVALNKGPRTIKTWEEWVRKDVGRCYFKFGKRLIKGKPSAT